MEVKVNVTREEIERSAQLLAEIRKIEGLLTARKNFFKLTIETAGGINEAKHAICVTTDSQHYYHGQRTFECRAEMEVIELVDKTIKDFCGQAIAIYERHMPIKAGEQ